MEGRIRKLRVRGGRLAYMMAYDIYFSRRLLRRRRTLPELTVRTRLGKVQLMWDNMMRANCTLDIARGASLLRFTYRKLKAGLLDNKQKEVI